MEAQILKDFRGVMEQHSARARGAKGLDLVQDAPAGTPVPTPIWVGAGLRRLSQSRSCLKSCHGFHPHPVPLPEGEGTILHSWSAPSPPGRGLG